MLLKRALSVIGVLTGVLSLSSCSTSPLGRRQLLVVPDGQMNSMGAQAFEDLKAKTPIEKNSGPNAYVRCITGPITEAAQGQTSVKEWEVVVFQDDTANAFALPGGKIGVHTGILKVATNDAQLAAVLGHEVGHVIAKHGAERVSDQLAAQGGLSALGALMGEGKTSNTLMGLLGLGAQVGILLPFSRTQESEADLIGLDLMARAGFDPRQSVELWHNMGKASGGAPPEFLSTHPGHETRISNLQSHLAEAMPKYEQAQAAGRAPHCQL